MRRESLKQAVAKVKYDYLGGCPVGGWPETEQAKRRLLDDIPRRAERIYTSAQLIDALYEVNSAGRYVRREPV